METATQAPSAFNAQQWRFVAVTDRNVKFQLKNATIEPNQRRVEVAALIMIVLGDSDGPKQLPDILRQSVEAGLLRKDISATWLELAGTAYGSNPESAKMDARRSACLFTRRPIANSSDRHNLFRMMTARQTCFSSPSGDKCEGKC